MTVEEMIAENKSKKLISLGYSYREYTDLNQPTKEFPNRDYKINKYYRDVPLQVTDEQFHEILLLGNVSASKKKAFPEVLQLIGILCFIGGFLIGFVEGEGRYGFDIIVMLTWWGAGLAAGLLWLWMSEVLLALRAKL